MCANWTQVETTRLLTIRAEAEIVRQLSGTVRDAVVYEQIKIKMQQRGFSREKAQVITKLKAVKKKFHQVLDHNGMSNSGRLDWPYFDLCYSIWGTSHSANPVALLGSMAVSPCRNDEQETTAEVAASSCTVVSTVASSSETVEAISRESNSGELHNYAIMYLAGLFVLCLPCITCFLQVTKPRCFVFLESPQPPPVKKARKHQSRTDLIMKEVKDLFFEMDRYFEERERVRLAEQREYENQLRREASQAREEELAKQMAMLRELQDTQNHFLSEILSRMPAPAPTPYYVPARHARFQQSTSDNTENGLFNPLPSLQLE
ncbi:uncharacterized protein LOC132152352 [Carassius carassius]|uniref:uncharacterized protein LOC132152352 n=1 Tax=Carassius carassius TaxID=217509 RepID=UPI002869574F|nr:uncharacterized protein LOC132152352 [Carassius carassius]